MSPPPSPTPTTPQAGLPKHMVAPNADNRTRSKSRLPNATTLGGLPRNQRAQPTAHGLYKVHTIKPNASHGTPRRPRPPLHTPMWKMHCQRDPIQKHLLLMAHRALNPKQSLATPAYQLLSASAIAWPTNVCSLGRCMGNSLLLWEPTLSVETHQNKDLINVEPHPLHANNWQRTSTTSRSRGRKRKYNSECAADPSTVPTMTSMAVGCRVHFNWWLRSHCGVLRCRPSISTPPASKNKQSGSGTGERNVTHVLGAVSSADVSRVAHSQRRGRFCGRQ